MKSLDKLYSSRFNQYFEKSFYKLSYFPPPRNKCNRTQGISVAMFTKSLFRHYWSFVFQYLFCCSLEKNLNFNMFNNFQPRNPWLFLCCFLDTYITESLLIYIFGIYFVINCSIFVFFQWKKLHFCGITHSVTSTLRWYLAYKTQ